MMWATIEKYKPQVQLFFKKQAELLGIDKLSWEDVGAPLQNLENPTISFPKAQELIIHQFGKFSSKMADFAKHAFDQGWIEAEDREGKRPGAFCAQFPARHQSRIFMTYDGSIDNVMTLAHELGHAYHNAVVQELPMMAQNYRMNVAETASTFAEWLVSDCFLEEEMPHAQKRVWLYEKINRSCLFLLNIQARFLFEKQFYEERKKGFVLSNRLNQIMQEAQETAFSSALAAYHPRFWAAKMHFYFTEVPFYNFPYTFGYLFSLGIYARALKGGFENSYDALLKDTGQMNVEELAQKHLNVDLSQAPFWEMALDLIAEDITQFVSV
jgi:oligoendopeptidase F